MKTVKITGFRINTRRPIYLFRTSKQALEVTEMEYVPALPNKEETPYKRAFSVRLGEAMKGVVFGKKSIQNVKKSKRKKK